MMRHIYDLGLSNIDGNTLEVEILDKSSNRLNQSTPENSAVPWIRIFGLDQTDTRGTGEPDSKVDLKSGVVDLAEGRLTVAESRHAELLARRDRRRWWCRPTGCFSGSGRR